jgi:hypothetical protein
MDQCENCKKPIEYVGLIWIPTYGQLKDFKLRFCSTTCVEAYKNKYSDFVGHESQCTNFK